MSNAPVAIYQPAMTQADATLLNLDSSTISYLPCETSLSLSAVSSHRPRSLDSAGLNLSLFLTSPSAATALSKKRQASPLLPADSRNSKQRCASLSDLAHSATMFSSIGNQPSPPNIHRNNQDTTTTGLDPALLEMYAKTPPDWFLRYEQTASQRFEILYDLADKNRRDQAARDGFLSVVDRPEILVRGRPTIFFHRLKLFRR